ncbi:MAG: SBBP repeat-containing protein [Bacteroidetes bacterium]|nr:SBBP repeat-containing protein [Bacteroidota bacterium]
MKTKLLLLILLAILNIYGQAQNFSWAKTIGGATQEDLAYSIKVDNFGNVYTAGHFFGTVDFDPGAGIYNLTAPGIYPNIYISKLDSAGNFIWAISLGGASVDKCHSIEIDESCNIYIAGFFHDTADFDPGVNVYNLISIGIFDAYISKIDSGGNLLWAKRLGGPLGDVSYSIGLDESKNIYTTGTFQGIADFDPGPGIYNLTSLSTDAFISKLDSNGNFLWAKSFYGASQAYALEIDHSGNVVVAGTFGNTVDFDPGIGVYYLNSPLNSDIFITKLDSSGNFIWAKSMGGINEDVAYAIAIDNLENIYCTGKFRYTVDFDPGVGTFIINSSGIDDVFILKLNSSGQFIWAKSISGQMSEIARALDLDFANNLYVSGSYVGTCDFDPGVGIFNVTSIDSSLDIFILRLDSAGNFNWAKSFGGIGFDYSFAVTTDVFGNIYSAGEYRDIVDFDPGPGIFNLTALGNNGDAFIHKISPCYLSNFTQSSCDSVAFNGQIYYSTGVYTQIFIDANGCDSVINLNLTITDIDTSVVQNGALCIANANFATYQWLSCIPFQIIIGEVNQSFTATANGSYAVIVSINGCSDTSSCFTVNNVGLSNKKNDKQYIIFPNPSTGLFILKTESHISNVEIVNVLGIKVFDSKTTATTTICDLRKQPMGIYFVRLLDDTKIIATDKILIGN